MTRAIYIYIYLHRIHTYTTYVACRQERDTPKSIGTRLLGNRNPFIVKLFRLDMLEHIWVGGLAFKAQFVL